MGARSAIAARWWGGSYARRAPYVYAPPAQLVWLPIPEWVTGGAWFAEEYVAQLTREALGWWGPPVVVMPGVILGRADT